MPDSSDADLPQLVHLTSKSNAERIQATGKIGGKYGIYAIDGRRLPKPKILRVFLTFLCPKNVEVMIAIPLSVYRHFRRVWVIGPYSLFRWWCYGALTPLGTIDIRQGTFIPNEIWDGKTFRLASAREKTRARRHAVVADYVVDGGMYLVIIVAILCKCFMPSVVRGLMSR